MALGAKQMLDPTKWFRLVTLVIQGEICVQGNPSTSSVTPPPPGSANDPQNDLPKIGEGGVGGSGSRPLQGGGWSGEPPPPSYPSSSALARGP